MRVRKKCPECQKLKVMNDFDLDLNNTEGRTNECSQCISILKYKTENQPLNLNKMATLKEKREAALVEKTAVAAVDLVAKKLAAPVATPAVPAAPKKKPTKKEVVVAVVEVPEGTTTAEVEAAVVGSIEEVGTVEAAVVVDVTDEAPVEAVVETPKAATPKAIVPAKVEKSIEQLDATGMKVIKTYKTLQEAADAVGATKAYLMDGLKGWSKSVKGFKWRYEGEEIVVREKKVKE